MLRERLRGFVFSYQGQFWPFLVAAGAGLLGVRLGVQACYALAPPESAFDFAALVVLFKCAKFCFAPRAILGLRHATQVSERLGYLALSALVLVLMASSIGPSYVFTTHNEARAIAAMESARAQALADSDEYAALSQDIRTCDEQIAAALEITRSFLNSHQTTKAGENNEKLNAVRDARSTAVARRAALQAAVVPATSSGGGIDRLIHLGAALALELVGVAASVLVRAGRSLATSAPAATETGAKGGNVVCMDVTRRSAKTQKPNAGQARVGSRFTECYAEARRLVESGTMKPTLDSLWRRFRVSQRPAKRILESLCADGVIQRAGRGYKRCRVLPPSVSPAV